MSRRVLVRLCCAAAVWLLGAGMAAVAADTVPGAAAEPALRYTVSWLGNSCAEPDTWVQMDAAAMFVARDGTVYLNVFWEEGGRNVGIYRDGRVVGNAGHTHGWGYEGGEAVTANDRYLFIAQRVNNEGGGLKSAGTWPPKGMGWSGVSRRRLDGQAAPFAGGKGGDGDTLKGCFCVVGEFPEKAEVAICGLAASEERLYVADGAGRVRVYDAETMASVGEWPAPGVRQLALAPDGSLWAVRGGPAPAVVHVSAAGVLLPEAVTEVAVPTALAVRPDGCLVVADDGPDQQVKVFDPTTGRRVGVLGEKGGVFSGVRGRVGPGRLNGPVGVGADGQGNLYVACRGRPDGNGSGLVLQSYRADGALSWELLGLEFVDNADVDPTADTNVYTKDEHVVLDYGRPRGQEWSYRGYTLDRFAYPNDPRLHVEFASPFVRRIQGQLVLFGTDMYSDHLLIYRLARRDEIAVPCGYVAQRHLKGDWPPGQPATGEWLWVDANGNGDFDPGEYESRPEDNPSCWGWWVDSRGDIWQAGDANRVRRLPCQGLDAHGVPRYSLAAATSEPAPAPFTNLQRLEYIPETDTLYLSGYSAEQANTKGNWKTVGKVVCRYDGWSAARAKRWELHPPFDEAQERSATYGTPVAMSVAGDYLFIVYLKTAEVRVYATATAAYCGTLRPGPGMSGWVDIPYGVRAHRRADGEYLVFVEEDWKAKIVLYRWRP